MFLIYQCYAHLTNKKILNFLSVCLFSKNLEGTLKEIIDHPPNDPYDYTYEWQDKKMFENESDLIKKQ